MSAKAVFYHAGCSVCVEAEHSIAVAIDTQKFDLEIVHLGDDRSRVEEAEKAGIKSVPALLLDGVPLHINHGADLSALK